MNELTFNQLGVTNLPFQSIFEVQSFHRIFFRDQETLEKCILYYQAKVLLPVLPQKISPQQQCAIDEIRLFQNNQNLM